MEAVGGVGRREYLWKLLRRVDVLVSKHNVRRVSLTRCNRFAANVPAMIEDVRGRRRGVNVPRLLGLELR